MSKLQTIDGAIIHQAIQESKSTFEVLRRLGFNAHVNYYKELRIRCEELGLELPKYKRSNNQVKIPLSDILVENSTYNTVSLKKRLIELDIKKNICEVCGQTPLWNEKSLTLQLDHINGINNDNRLENLRIICPNCHTQTETFCGRGKKGNRDKNGMLQPLVKKSKRKNACDCGSLKSQYATFCRHCANRNQTHKKKIEWPSDYELLFMLEESNFLQVAKKLGVTDNAIRKHLKLQRLQK